MIVRKRPRSAPTKADRRPEHSPAVTLAVVSSLSALLGTGFGAVLQGYFNLELKRLEFESQLIKDAIVAGKQDETQRNLKFLVKAGLIHDRNGAISALEASELPLTFGSQPITMVDGCSLTPSAVSIPGTTELSVVLQASQAAPLALEVSLAPEHRLWFESPDGTLQKHLRFAAEADRAPTPIREHLKLRYGPGDPDQLITAEIRLSLIDVRGKVTPDICILQIDS